MYIYYHISRYIFDDYTNLNFHENGEVGRNHQNTNTWVCLRNPNKNQPNHQQIRMSAPESHSHQGRRVASPRNPQKTRRASRSQSHGWVIFGAWSG